MSEKQRLLPILEKAYAKATSQKAFYIDLQKKGIQLYTYRGEIRGVKSTRKFRFRTLGYNTEILKLLDKKVEKSARLEALRNIRESQQEHSLGRERTRKR
ncbi:hypothetical protein [uncultured Dokdonia sp.]|uniref:hypothetical protein n=1 Tax=uncultured Dokdonia sp. TaxID=575653 RepID=UPI00262BC740|nr:hypothetical protein [uncultured Dokdonia sp.]